MRFPYANAAICGTLTLTAQTGIFNGLSHPGAEIQGQIWIF